MSFRGRRDSLPEWLAWLERLHPREIDLGLERVGAVAGRLGLIHSDVVTLTVAGTNGKGSSASLAAQIYQNAGYRVGLYTSPHLMAYNERIRIDGQVVGDAEICIAFDKIEQQRGQTGLTYFEFGTLAALYLFRERGVELQVLEVGLGGRLDAVNIVDADAALVTSIGIDHVDWLGPDRESIGLEKAHVFRSGRPAICADSSPPESLRAHARSVGAGYLEIGTDFHLQCHDGDWSWHCGLRQLPLPRTDYLNVAAHRGNAAGVLTAVDCLQPRLPVGEHSIAEALTDFCMPGRFERRGRLILDVAHNMDAAGVLLAQLRQLRPGHRFPFVLGMLKDKDVEAYCNILRPVMGQVYCIGLGSPRGLDSATLQRRVASLGIAAQACESIEKAVGQALNNFENNEVVVTGSFLTVAAGMAYG